MYALAAIAALLGTAIWTLFDTSPAGIVSFPNNAADIVFHVGSAAVFAVVLVVHFRRA